MVSKVNIEQRFTVSIFNLDPKKTIANLFVRLFNQVLARVRTTGQQIRIEYLPGFLLLPLLFFNHAFRTRFSSFLNSNPSSR